MEGFQIKNGKIGMWEGAILISPKGIHYPFSDEGVALKATETWESKEKYYLPLTEADVKQIQWKEGEKSAEHN